MLETWYIASIHIEYNVAPYDSINHANEMSISFLMYYFMYDVGYTDCEMLIILNGVPRFGVHGSSNTRFWDMGKSQGQTVPLIRLFLLIFTLVLNIPIIFKYESTYRQKYFYWQLHEM